MPDFRVLPSNPVIDTGAIYTNALGNNKSSSFAAGVEGVKSGLAFGADLTAQVLETQRINDPERLAAEQLRRELENDQTAEAIEYARIRNEYAGEDFETTIEARRTNTEGQSIENELDRIYGSEDRATTIEARRVASQVGRANAYGQVLENDLTKRYGEAEKLSEIRDKLEERRKAGADTSSMVGADGRLNLGGGLPSVQFDRLPGAQGSTVISAIDQRIEELLGHTTDLETAEKNGELLQKKDAVITQKNARQLANKKYADQISNTNVARQNYDTAMGAVMDRGFDGAPNYSAAIGPVAQLNLQYERAKDPAQKQLYSAQLSDIIETLGPEGIEDYIASLPDDRAKSAASKVLNKAIVNSGNPNLLGDDQKIVLQAGLDFDHAVNFDDTLNKTNTLITSGTAGIDDPAFKKAMRSSEYVIAASKASKNGTQGYIIVPNRIAAGEGGPDTFDMGQSQKVMEFRGTDGTVAYAPVPTDDKTEAELSLVEKASTVQSTQLQQSQRTDESIGQINQMQAEKQPEPVSEESAQPPDRTVTPEQGKKALDFVLQHKYQSTPDEEVEMTEQQRVLKGLPPLNTGSKTKLIDQLGSQKEKFQSGEQKKIDETMNAARTRKQQQDVLDQIIQTVEAEGNPDLLGTAGKSWRNFIENIESSSWYALPKMSDEAQRKLNDLGQQAKSLGLLTAKNQYKLTGQQMNTQQEQENISAAQGSLENGYEQLKNVRDALAVDSGADMNIATLGTLMNEMNLKPGTYRALHNEYFRKHAAEKIVNPARSKDVSQPMFIPNPNGFKTPEQFLAEHPITSKLGALSAQEGLPSSGDLGLPDENQPDTVVPGNVGEADLAPPGGGGQPPPPAGGTGGGGQGVPPTGQPIPNSRASKMLQEKLAAAEASGELAPSKPGEDLTSGIVSAPVAVAAPTPGGVSYPTPEGVDLVDGKLVAPEDSSPYATKPGKTYTSEDFLRDVREKQNQDFDKVTGVVTNLADGLNLTEKGKTASRADLVEERSKQDPEFRKYVDKAKAELKRIDDAIPGYNVKEKIFRSVTPDFLENLANKGAEYTDPIYAKASSLLTGSTYEEALTERKASRQAEDEFFEDEAIESPKEQLAIDILGLGIATELAGVGVLKGAAVVGKATGLTAKLTQAAQNSPMIARALRTITGGKFDPAAVGKAGVLESTATGAVKTGAQATLDASVMTSMSDELNEEDFASIAKMSAGTRLVLKALGPLVARPLLRSAKNTGRLVVGGDTAEPLAKELIANGVSKQTVDDWVATYKTRVAAGDDLGNILADAPPEVRATVESLANTKGGRQVIGERRTDIEAQKGKDIKTAEQRSGVDQAPEVKSVQGQFDKNIGDQVESKTGQAASDAATAQEQSIRQVLAKTGQQSADEFNASVDEITQLSYRKPSKAPIAKSSGGSTQLDLPKMIDDLTTAEETLVTKHMSPEIEAIEKTYRQLPNAPFEKTDKLFNNGPQELARIWNGLKEEVAKKLSGTKGSQLEKLVGPIKRDSNGNVILKNNFKFIDEMIQQVASKDTNAIVQTSKQQKTLLLKELNDAMEAALTDAGAPPGYFQKVHGAYRNVSGVRDKIVARREVLEDIQHAMNDAPGQNSNLHGKFYKDAAAKKQMIETFGKQGSDDIQSSLRAIDRGSERVNKIAGARTPEEMLKLKEDVVSFGDDLRDAGKLTGNDKFFIEPLINAKNESVVDGLMKTVKDPDLLRDGAMRWVADRMAKKNVNAATPHEFLGLTPRQWSNAKKLLGKDADLVEQSFRNLKNIESASNIFDSSGKTVQKESGTQGKIALRRVSETSGLFLSDIFTAMGKGAITRVEARAIINDLTTSNVKNLEELIGRVSGAMEKVQTPTGTKTIVKGMTGSNGRIADLTVFAIVSNKMLDERKKKQFLEELKAKNLKD